MFSISSADVIYLLVGTQIFSLYQRNIVMLISIYKTSDCYCVCQS